MANQNVSRTLPPNERKFWAEKPVRFVKNRLNINPWRKQQDILEALAKHNRVAVRSCNGSGKTFTAALATIWWLMAHDEAIVITTAPTERQVKQLLWREIRKIHVQNQDLIGGKITSTRLELNNQLFAFGFSTNTAERFQGFHHQNILIVVDEASGVHEFIFDAILGAMSTKNSKMLMIGNPTALAGTFYNAFHKNRQNWKTIHISAFDTPAFQNHTLSYPSPLPPPPAPQDETDPCAEMQSNYGYDISSGEEEGVPTNQTEANTPNNQHPKITAHHSIHIIHSSENQTEANTPNNQHHKITAHHSDHTNHSSENQTAANTPNNENPKIKTHHSDHINHSSNIPPGMATPDWANLIAQEQGTESAAYQIRVLGEFPSQADDTLIPLNYIEAAVDRHCENIDEHPTVMGLDIARFGDSKTVAVIRKGPKVLHLAAFRKSDLMQTVGRTLDLARRHNVETIYVDEVGLGAGVLDRLNEINDIEAAGINVGNKADNTERYANLRAQMLDGLRERFADNDISIPNDDELISQLASLTYTYTSRGQLQLRSKQQIRDSGRQSPDKADALTLAFTSPTPNKNPLMIWI